MQAQFNTSNCKVSRILKLEKTMNKWPLALQGSSTICPWRLEFSGIHNSPGYFRRFKVFQNPLQDNIEYKKLWRGIQLIFLLFTRPSSKFKDKLVPNPEEYEAHNKEICKSSSQKCEQWIRNLDKSGRRQSQIKNPYISLHARSRYQSIKIWTNRTGDQEIMKEEKKSRYEFLYISLCPVKHVVNQSRS